jgi:phospholipid/cholesterol/gamma-HCH transport system permease protein
MTAIRTLLERVGAAALDGARAAGGLRRVLTRTVIAAARGRREPGTVLEQMHQVGSRSLLFVAVTLGFLGMVLVFQTCLQINRVTGDLSQIGAEFLKILVHEFGPTLTAMMLATRVGAGIAAEVGSMTVTEQVDALRMSGVDPIEYLIVPRFLACIVMMVVLATFAVVIALGAGALTAWASFQVNPRIFFDVGKVTGGDLGIGLLKCLAYGAAIPVVSGWCGLVARGGSEGVGTATTRAVIGSSFAVILLDFLLSGLGYFTIQGEGGV